MVKKILILFSLLLFMSFQAEAADKEMIELKSVSEVEVTVENDKAEQEVIRIDAAMANVTPCDTVIFTNYYANNGDLPADDVILINPLPEHMVYVGGTAEGKGTRIEFSVNQGENYGPPEELIIKDEEGKERIAVASDYTHIRWTFAGSIDKGDSGSVSFQAKIK